MALTFETVFSLHKMNPTQPAIVSITSKAHHSTFISHVIPILPASVMGEYFERPSVTVVPPSSTLSVKKIKKEKKRKEDLLLRIYNEVK